MNSINLLPWREGRRRRRNRSFACQIIVAALAALTTALGVYQFIGAEFARQKGRNALLQQEINRLDEDLAQIRRLQGEQEDLLARIGAIQELRGPGSSTARVLDSMARVLPDGLVFDLLARRGAGLRILGQAESHAQIPALMRNLAQIGSYAEPRLRNIAENQANTIYSNGFELTLDQTSKLPEAVDPHADR